MDNCTDSKMSVNAQSVEWQPKVVLDRDVVDKKLKEQARQKRRAAKSELTLRCRHCEKKFRNLSDVAEHAHQHVSQLICCIVCHKKFANLKSARKHLVVDKHYTPDPCVICGLETATKSEMTAHAAQHIKNNVGYYCFCCGFKFENQSELSKHRKEQWEKAAYDCSTCGMRFKSETRLNTHQDSHKKHICQFCKSTWYSKGSLDAHLFISHQYVDSANSATSSTMISMPLE